MNHQPYENWLLGKEKLAAEDSHRLQQHLRGCEHCMRLVSNLGEVEKLFRQVERVQPAAGFTARWQARSLQRALEEQKRQFQRQGWWMLGLFGAGSFILLGLLSFTAYSIYRSPVEIFLALVDWMSRIYSILNVVEVLAETVGRVIVPNVHPIIWIFAFGSFLSLTVLWAVSIKVYLLPRRVEA